MKAVCLAIGGSDSSGGAGIQADLATFAGLGVKGCCAITALTAQNPSTINRIEPCNPEQLEAEIRTIFDHYDVRAVKTGMLVDASRVMLVARLLAEMLAGKPLVVDPVFLATSGSQLLDAAAYGALKTELFPLATLITPNIPEAEVLLGKAVSNPVEDVEALTLHYKTAVLLTGGHGKGKEILDVLCETSGDVTPFVHARKDWSIEQSHGSGCRLAAAITAHLASGKILAEAVSSAVASMQPECE